MTWYLNQLVDPIPLPTSANETTIVNDHEAPDKRFSPLPQATKDQSRYYFDISKESTSDYLSFIEAA